MNTLLHQIDQERIRGAVAEAEARTAGEIVPVVVPRCDDYDVAVWRGASLGALFCLAAALLVLQFYEGWGLGWLFAGWGVALVALAGGTAGALLAAYVPPIERLLAGAERLDRAVHQRAMQAFVEEEVFNTRDRTGILLFVALLEHRIEVLGDAGINEKVAPEDWVEIVAQVRDGITSGHVTDGLVGAIERCGSLLERSGVALRPDDANELSDQVRIRRDDA